MAGSDLARSIREMIVSLEIKPGTWMREEYWASKFGVSRVPIREAFAELQRADLLVRKRNRGYLNPPLTRTEKNELIEILNCLEIMAIRSPAFNAPRVAELLSEIGQANHWLEATPEKLVAMDREWHTVIVEAGSNAIASQFHSDIMDRTQRYAFAYWKFSETSSVSFSEHDHIQTALADDDLNLACAALTSHYRKSIDRTEKVFDHFDQEENNTNNP